MLFGLWHGFFFHAFSILSRSIKHVIVFSCAFTYHKINRGLNSDERSFNTFFFEKIFLVCLADVRCEIFLR